MPDPFIMFIGGYIATNAPNWLKDMRGTLLDTSKGLVVEKGKGLLNDKEQERHLQQILKKAVQQGRTQFRKQQEREQYKDVLTVFFEPGEHSDALRQEAMTLFSLNPTPNITELNEIYNRSLRTRTLSQSMPPAEVHVSPYLTSFFDALIIELYADPFFKSQIRDVVQTRAAMILPSSLNEANTTLHQIHDAINHDYTKEQFEQDVAKYTIYIEQTLHTLKIIGFLPKDQKQDPEINGIFVPLRVALNDNASRREEQQNTIVSLLEQHPHIVMLGAPGSGKSTAIRHLAWSHAWANQEQSQDDSIPLLSGHPLPLRIELRLLMQDRKQNSAYSFLSYATEVLLGREGIIVNPQMFEKLLEQKRMLVLFDGLDEVTTLDERQRLVQEIEHFVGLYPGNRILVTSRPVGYELASCSRHLFAHAKVQDFDDTQIHQFLERWYTYVLRLSPLPYQERQELETLFKTLKENSRLHKLAENPLLLTVITALYRSQRLPEKRVQVYDKCAELLLATWAKLKGTDARWSMKLSEDDQFACIAHLGYTLHKRSQEENDGKVNRIGTQDAATDVPERFMLREIKGFLQSGKLLTEIAEQGKEAERFLNLMQVETGLIVERGKDENGASVYGFVHRTFQEYFAAADVYKRFTDYENPIIIHNFLVEHLHDPHWHEVVLLLLGKLGRRPVTQRLRQILDGTIKSHRSRYKEIVQQDLFFVSDCLIEEIVVENDLVEEVISLLSNIVLTSPFSSQSGDAVRRLGQLMETKQCAVVAEKEMMNLAVTDKIIDFSLKTLIVQTLYQSSPDGSQEQRQATQLLLALAQQPHLSIEQQIQALRALYQSSPAGSQEWRQATQLLLALAQQPHLSIEQQIQALRALYQSSPDGSQERQQAIQLLLSLAQQPHLSIEQQIQALRTLYQSNPFDAQERQQAIQLLLALAQQPHLSIEQQIQALRALYQSSPDDSQEWRQATQLLLALAQQPHLSIEQQIQALRTLYQSNPFDAQEQRQATQMLLALAQQPHLSIEQQIQALQALYQSSSIGSQEELQAIQMLLSLAQQPHLSIEQQIQALQVVYPSSPDSSQEELQAIQMLLSLAQQPHLSIEQQIQALQALYQRTIRGSEKQLQVVQMIWDLARNERCTHDQRVKIVTIPIADWNASYLDKLQAVQELQAWYLVENLKDYLTKWWRNRSEYSIPNKEFPSLAELAQNTLLSSEIHNQMYAILRNSVSQFNEIPSIDTRT